MRQDIASQAVDLMLEYGRKLDELLILIQRNCSDEEFKRYRKAIGYIMGYMLTAVMNPIFEEHPELRPEELTEEPA
jgi:hypothetical protein